MSVAPATTAGVSSIPRSPTQSRDLAREHFLGRSRKRLGADAYEILAATLETSIQVPKAAQDSVVRKLKVDGNELPVFDAPQDVAGEPVLYAVVGGTNKVIASLAGDHIRFGFDVWTSLGAMLTGDFVGVRGTSPSFVPVVDLLENRIFEALEATLGPLRPSWPNGAQFALGLSHDVDRTRKTFQFVTHSLRELSRGKPKRALAIGLNFDEDAYWCFETIRKLERRHDVSSTFFFLHETSEGRPAGLRERFLQSGICRLDDARVVDEIRSLASDRWEIGLHSSSYSLGDLRRLEHEKALLDGIVGHGVSGVRQHLLAPSVSSLWRGQISAGFGYDSTMGFARGIGFRAGTSYPYAVPFSKDFLEIPFGIMDGALQTANIQPEAACDRLLDSVASVGGALVLLWHQRFFSDREFPGFSSIYERLIQQALSRGAWVAPLGQIAEWWRGAGT